MIAQHFAELCMDGVGRSFGAHAALADFDLTVRSGEFVALLGPSGCGKSTALNCVAGLLPLSTGSITMDRRRIDHLPPERRGFGMVFQSYALFPHLTVASNVAFGLRMRKVGKAERRRRVAQALDTVRLTDHAERYPSQLSGGQQQRVAIARAIAMEPQLVLMDEPLSNLDARLRLDMRTEVRRLHQALGLTTVYVTHDQEEALSLADRVVLLRDGRVQQVGSPEEVYTSPASAYVAGFMGYRTMLELNVESVREGRAQLRGLSLALEGVCRAPAVGSRALAAVRPEDFRVGASGPNQVAVRVEVVEYHGREQAVEARVADGRVLALRTSARLAPGDEVTVSVAPERVLVFPTGGPEWRAAAEPEGEQASAIGSQASQPCAPPTPIARVSRR